jgi:hypothetical protein
MHRNAAKVVRQAMAAGAAIDPVEHYDDLAALDAAARATECLPLWRQCDLLDRPILVGGTDRPVALWPPSYAALKFIAEMADACGDDSGLMAAWALAHGRDARVLRELGADPRRNLRRVRDWAYGLDCGLQALLHAASGLLKPAQDQAVAKAGGKREDAPNPFREHLVMARIVREFGQDEEYWLYGPRDRLDAALELLRQADKAEVEAMAKAGGRQKARDPDSPEVLTFVAWRKAEVAFLKKFQSLGKPAEKVPVIGNQEAGKPRDGSGPAGELSIGPAHQPEQAVEEKDKAADRHDPDHDHRQQQDDDAHRLTP